MSEKINKFLDERIDEKNEINNKLKNVLFKSKVNKSIKLIFKSLRDGGKILLCGNGGSAGDAQHLAAELLVRLRPKVNRNGLPALSLATDISTVTACANDFSYDKIFSRNLETLGNRKDILIAISTSGNSKNILEVLKSAKKKKITSIAFLGNNGGSAKKYADINLIIPSKITARIQECHIFLGHVIFEAVENLIISKSEKKKSF